MKRLSGSTENNLHVDLFTYNEKQANRYSCLCLLAAAGITAVMWLLNVLGFFIVDKTLMNIVMPVGIVLLVLPFILEKSGRVGGGALKYVIMCCFLIGIGAMSAVLAIQLTLAWACPVILSCHFYRPKFTLFTFAGTLAFMLASFYAGIYIGVWDANIMRSSDVLNTVAERAAFISACAAAGDNILLRAFNFYYLPRAVIVSVIAVVGVMLSKRTRGLLTKQSEIVRETERIGAELSVATQIQTSLLPSVETVADRREFAVFAAMYPAKEVGGDFYDFFMVDDTHLAVVVADVSDKGVPAALFMTIGKTLIKDHTRPRRDLGEVFTEVNSLLCESNSRGLFITAFEGVLDLESGEFAYVNAGHELPMLARSGQLFAPLCTRSGFVLAGMEDTVYRAGSMRLAAGDRLFLYTDGVTDANDEQGRFFGRERLINTLNGALRDGTEQIIMKVKQEIDRFAATAPQFDDITALCLQYRGRA